MDMVAIVVKGLMNISLDMNMKIPLGKVCC